MRYYVLFLLAGLFGFANATIKETSKDSLMQVLSHADDAREQVKLLRNLADLHYKQPQEADYLKQLIGAAEKSHDKSALVNAMSDLANCYIETMRLDSARYYKDKIAAIESDVETECRLVCLELKLFDLEVTQENKLDVINEKVKKSMDACKVHRNNIYAEIEEAYVIAGGLYAQKRIKDALPYYDSAAKLAEQLPLKEGFDIRFYILKNRERTYTVDSLSSEGIQMVKEYSRLLDTYYQKYMKKERPFFPVEIMQLYNYTAILGSYQFLEDEEIEFYMRKVRDLSTHLTDPKDIYYKYLSMTCYYSSKNDYRKVLQCTDSLLKYAQIVLPYKIPALYSIKSQVYEAMKEFPQALQYLKMYYAQQDSLTTAKSMEQLNQLQVSYDFHKLNYEKSQLKIRNRQILLLSLCIILLISMSVSVVLYRNLKKERMMKAAINALKDKAEESEKMKTAFIGSVCHEIRTPLNAIVGFTDLILDTSIDEETRRMFPEEIQRNTFQLTSLINSMLEVSNLDVSDEKLHCEPVDLVPLCHREMEIILRARKPEIEYRLNISDGSVIVSTNERYLALVIENLLGNANKFTDSGEITLTCQTDKEKGKLLISVTDTGCGIPADKCEEVFERFTKLDSFKPGNGLGLYLCRLIIRRLSGDIKVDSTYTKGTRMLIILPLE